MITIALGTTPTILVKFNEVSPNSFVIADLTIKKVVQLFSLAI